MMSEKIKKPTKAWRSSKKSSNADAEESELRRLQYEVLGLRYCNDCELPYVADLLSCPQCPKQAQT